MSGHLRAVWLRRLVAMSFAFVLTLGLAACDDGPAEQVGSEAGAAVDDAVEATGDALEEAGDAAGQAIEDAGEAIEQATD